MNAPVIALDIGGTRTRAALIEPDRRIAWRDARTTPSQDGPDALIAAIASMLAPLAGSAAPVGLAIAGQVAEGRITAHNPALLRGWDAYPLQSVLAERLGRSVLLVNDARAAAWGEFRFGAGRGCSEFAFVTVSTGIGAGLVLGGRLHLARNGLDAELGETLCADDRTLEDHASGTALGAFAAAHGFVDARGLCDAADAGDPRAGAELDRGIRLLAGKLADLRVNLGIERCAIGGGVGLRPTYLSRLRAQMSRWPSLYGHEIIAAELGADAGLHGVAALVSCPPS